MKTVYKYVVETGRYEVNLQVPGYRKPLHVGLDPAGVPSLWMEVDTNSVPVPFTIYIVGTGQEVPQGKQYIGSFVEGPYVWHVYYS